MLGYFPAPYPDELLYSVLSRLARDTAVSSRQLSRVAFGDANACAGIDLPSRIAWLARNLPPPALTPDEIVDQLTLFNYYAAFRDDKGRGALRRAMLSDAPQHMHLWTGLAASTVGRVTRLRFCPLCDRAMHGEHGERWWRRAFQLPSVLVCPDHRCVLLESRVDVGAGARQDYAWACEATSPWAAAPVCATPVARDLQRLVELARASIALLNVQAATWRPDSADTGYRAQLKGAGLMRSARKVDQDGLAVAIERHWGRALILLPGVLTDEARPGAWLSELVRRHRKAFHPLHHLLLRGCLESVIPVEGPFGCGPWPCRNPLASHSGKNVVTELVCAADAGATTGTFTCRCGYVYTRRRFADGAIGPPRLKRYGPLLRPALQRLLTGGSSRRAVSAALCVDAKTMLRFVVELGLEAPWQLPSTQPTKAKGASPARKPLVRKSRRKAVARRDWPRLDAAMVASLKAASAIIIAASDPIKRVTFAELERRVRRCGCLRRRRAKLPNAFACAQALVEDVDTFRRRRLAVVCARMRIEDPSVTVSQVLRRAGLPGSYVKLAQALLDRDVAQRLAA